MSGQGREEIPLDLSSVPTVEAGLAKAADNDRAFTDVAGATMGPRGNEILLTIHIPFLGFVSRAVAVHRGIVFAIEQENPHVAFTLIRSYLELVALTYTVLKDPSYLDRLARPAKDLPADKRPWRIKRIITRATKAMPGLAHVYYSLSEQMAHFGSTALWQPFNVLDRGERRMSYTTYPHWKHEDDPRTALAMLLENDAAMLNLLRAWDLELIAPVVQRLLSRPADEESSIA